MKTDTRIGGSDQETETDTPDVTTWFDETDRALGDCLERIERVAPDVASHHAVRGELLFLLRAARADLLTHYLEATHPPRNRIDAVRYR